MSMCCKVLEEQYQNQHRIDNTTTTKTASTLSKSTINKSNNKDGVLPLPSALSTDELVARHVESLCRNREPIWPASGIGGTFIGRAGAPSLEEWRALYEKLKAGARVGRLTLLPAAAGQPLHQKRIKVSSEKDNATTTTTTITTNTSGLCDRCDGELSARADDSAATIKARLDSYDEKTGPVVKRLAELGLLHEIDASLAPDDVTRNIVLVIESAVSPPRTSYCLPGSKPTQELSTQWHNQVDAENDVLLRQIVNAI